MKLPNKYPVFIFTLCLFLIGCTSNDPSTSTVSTTVSGSVTETSPTLTRQPATAVPTTTPLPTSTPPPTPIPPTLTSTPLPPTPTSTLPPTATTNPVSWAAGLLWDEERTVLYVGNSSISIFDTRISFEAMDETVAETIANIPVGALVVFYGEFTVTPDAEWIGHMVVEEAEQVQLPFDDETEFSAEFSHRDNIFSFAYPEDWTLIDDGDAVFLFNRSEEYAQYSGPGIEYYDPTAIRLSIRLEPMALAEFVQSRLENAPDSAVSEVQISGWQLTLIEEESYLFGTFLHYVIPIDDTMVLVLGCDAADADFTEQFLTTLVLNR